MFHEKRKRAAKRLLVTALAACMVLGPGSRYLSPVQTAEAARVFSGTGNELEGGLSPQKPTKAFRLYLPKTSRVDLICQETYIGGCSTRIVDMSTGETVYALDLNEDRPEYAYYLQAGTYNLYIDANNAYYPTYGSFSFMCDITPTTESFPEEAGRSDDLFGTANKISLGNYYQGTITENEPTTYSGYKRSDIYRFHMYYDDVAPTFNFSTNIKICSVDIYRANGSRIYGTTFGTGNDAHNKTANYTPNVSCWGAGEYYMVVSSYQAGEYSIYVNQNDSTMQFISDLKIPVGSKGTMKQDQSYFSGDWTVYYEAGNQKGLTFGTGNKKADYEALSAGRTTVYAYGTDNKTGKHKRGFYSVTVEFTDVRHDNSKPDPYYYNPVYWAVDEGITAGVKDSKGVNSRFDPDGICSRAQMISFLWRMAGCPEPETYTEFSDVDEKAYFYKAVSWAQEMGITGGYADGTFRPYNQCSRAQAVSFLYRMEGCPAVEKNSSSDFKDIHPGDGKYYNDAVLWAVQNGITGGYSDKTFRPDNLCSRAQMVTFLFRDITNIHSVG